MVASDMLGRGWLGAVLVCGVWCESAWAQQGSEIRPLPPRAAAPSPLRLADRHAPPQGPVPTKPLAAKPNEHPLMPALRWAYEGLENIEKIQDYSATMVKRERFNGKVREHEYMFVKIRHQPFSVYMYFLAPASLKGREVIFVQGRNNGKMWAHTTGVQDALVGTVSLAPDHWFAMRGNHYPLTEIGIMNMVRRLVEVGQQDAKYGECEVKFFKGAKINQRTCTCIQVLHPVPRSNFIFHLARIFVDDELNVPIRFEAYDWPAQPGGPPRLIEEYTYLNLKLNVGFTDADFDIRNPNYAFR